MAHHGHDLAGRVVKNLGGLRTICDMKTGVELDDELAAEVERTVSLTLTALSASMSASNPGFIPEMSTIQAAVAHGNCRTR
jgi:hypothetical protein